MFSFLGFYTKLEGACSKFLSNQINTNSITNMFSICCCSSKRGLDLGLGRGFSGSQAAKHLMGLAAANFAGGPGRRRRSEEDA